MVRPETLRGPRERLLGFGGAGASEEEEGEGHDGHAGNGASLADRYRIYRRVCLMPEAGGVNSAIVYGDLTLF